MSNVKTKQWEHQKRSKEYGIKHIHEYGFAFLTMDMGTGKTKSSIDIIAEYLSLHTEVRRVLILCPKAVVPVWPDEFKTHAAINYRMLALSGKESISSKTEKAHAFLSYSSLKVSVIVINYESGWRAPFGEWLMRYYQPQIIVADESHKLKTPTSKQGMFFSRLASKSFARVKIAMTGTPMASPLDLFGQFRFLNPKIFGTSYIPFKNKFAVLGGPDKNFIVGFKNLDELHGVYNHHSFSVRADEVLDLPESKDAIMFAEMNGTSKRMYKELRDDLVASLPGDIGDVEVANAMTKVLHLQQVTSGFAKSGGVEHIIDDGKLKALEEFLDDIHQDEPVVVFTRFTIDATRVYELLKKAGRNPGYQTGKASDWERFRDKEIDSIVVNTASGGAGISLVRARYAVYYSVGYNVLDYQQSRRRLVRPGQKRPCTFYHICVQNTVDEHIYGIYKKRLTSVAEVDEGMMSDADVTRNLLSMMKQDKEAESKRKSEASLLRLHTVEELQKKGVIQNA